LFPGHHSFRNKKSDESFSGHFLFGTHEPIKSDNDANSVYLKFYESDHMLVNVAVEESSDGNQNIRKLFCFLEVLLIFAQATEVGLQF
jgi:hypothetical protein